MPFPRTNIQAVLFVAIWPTIAGAATVTGTVIGPDGPVAGAKIIANECAGQPVENTADDNGNFSIDFADVTLDCIKAAAPQNNSGLIGEVLNWVDVSFDRELYLYLEEHVEFQGTIVFPDGYDGDSQLHVGRMDPPLMGSVDWGRDGSEQACTRHDGWDAQTHRSDP